MMTNDQTAVIPVGKNLPTTQVTRKQTLMPLSVEEIIQIDHWLKEIMDTFEEGLQKDFAVIPGTNTKSLLQGGAQRLNTFFQLSPMFMESNIEDLGDGHRNYISTCHLINRNTGETHSTGQGSCSTMESKYRWRKKVESTGKLVPNEYWEKRDISLLGGKGFQARKNDVTGKYEIFQVEGKAENEDIADVYNTVLKMANKRAYVSATMNAYPISRYFTQDMEDMSENEKSSKQKTEKKTESVKDETIKENKDELERSLRVFIRSKYKEIQDSFRRNGLNEFNNITHCENGALQFVRTLTRSGNYTKTIVDSVEKRFPGFLNKWIDNNKAKMEDQKEAEKIQAIELGDESVIDDLPFESASNDSTANVLDIIDRLLPKFQTKMGSGWTTEKIVETLGGFDKLEQLPPLEEFKEDEWVNFVAETLRAILKRKLDEKS
jgi:hypothetical protein